jgi:hypothetical protein
MHIELFDHRDGSWHARVNVHGRHAETGRFKASTRWRSYARACLAGYRLALDLETGEPPSAPSVMPKRGKR